VIRRWEWNALREDSTQTDAQGNFVLPAIFEFSLTRWLPVELVISQGLYMVVGGVERKIWSSAKREPEENAEFSGRPISMVCEMTQEMKLHRESGSPMNTLCTWEK